MLLPDMTAVLLEQTLAMSDGCSRAQTLRVTKSKVWAADGKGKQEYNTAAGMCTEKPR